ncbi:MAG: 30S ribosomal protein S13 [Candidatus Omnitrophica bacterium]|nr:30S ribosomal protein S13 [Candidatus Omnitrophota bacterium]
MPRIMGVDIPREKNSWIALTYLYGVGRTTSKKILKKANVDPNKRAKDLTDQEVSLITSILQEQYKVEGDLRRDVQQNIKRLMDVRAYRGLRHIKGLPVHGQRTHTNARTRKGPRRTMSGLNKKPPSPK